MLLTPYSSSGLVFLSIFLLENTLTVVSETVGLVNFALSLDGSFSLCLFFISTVSLSQVSLTRSGAVTCFYNIKKIQELMS